MAIRLTREEVPIEETWRLEDLFPSMKDWEAALKAVDSEITQVTRYKGRLGEGASVLLECLEAAENLIRKFYHVELYAGLLLASDGTNPANQAIAGRLLLQKPVLRLGYPLLKLRSLDFLTGL